VRGQNGGPSKYAFLALIVKATFVKKSCSRTAKISGGKKLLQLHQVLSTVRSIVVFCRWHPHKV
jgi:hypothetical protein